MFVWKYLDFGCSEKTNKKVNFGKEIREFLQQYYSHNFGYDSDGQNKPDLYSYNGFLILKSNLHAFV
jgi:hypothetical protein